MLGVGTGLPVAMSVTAAVVLGGGVAGAMLGVGTGLPVAMSVTAAVVLGGGVAGAMLGVDAVPSVAISAALTLELGSEEVACVLKGGNAVAVPTSAISELLTSRPAPVEVLRSLTLMTIWFFKSWDAVGAAVGGVSPRSAAKVCGELSIPWAVRTSKIAPWISDEHAAAFRSARLRISVIIAIISAILSGSAAAALSLLAILPLPSAARLRSEFWKFETAR